MKKSQVKRLIMGMIIMTLPLGWAVACQVTPEETVVIQRDNTEQKVLEASENNETVEPEPYEVPEHVDDRFTIVDGVLDVVIDADVNMPDIDTFPVALVKSAPFTQDDADRLREYFVQDGRMVSEYVMTKSDYDALIIEAKRGYEVDGEFVFDESSQEWVDELIKKREKAPEEDSASRITDFSIDGEGLIGRIIRDGKERGTLSINEDSIYLGGYKNIWQASKTYYDINDQAIELELPEVRMTEEDAIAAAENILDGLGVSGLEIKEIDKAYFYDVGDKITDGTDDCGYYFVFMRSFGGMMPVLINSFGTGPDDQFDVSPPVGMEAISLAIDEDGEVVMFDWRNPVEIIETMTEHVDILPFEEILERMETASKLQFSYMENYYKDEIISIKKVYKIGLYINYLPIKNKTSEFMLAPCWYFIYKDTFDLTDEQRVKYEGMGYHFTSEELMGDEYFIFSAVDGSSVSVYSTAEYEEMMSWQE